MKKKEFLLLLDQTLELDPGTLNGTENLADLGVWDSMAILSFLAMADTNFGFAPPAQTVGQCKSVADLVSLLGDKLTD